MQVNRTNYETFFMLYLDGELSLTDREAVEKFLTENPDLRKEFASFSQTIFNPEPIVFEHKELLLKKEENRKVFAMFWVRAAAVIVLVLGSWYIISSISGAPFHSSRLPSNTEVAAQKNKPVENPSSTETEKKTGTPDAQTDNIRGNNKPVELTAGNLEKKKKTQPVNHVPDESPAAVADASVAAKMDEPIAAVRKSSMALELQSVGKISDGSLENVVGLPSAEPAVVMVIGGEIKSSGEKGVRKETIYQNENAVSVVALNDKNKGITGFFNKLTKRAPVDEGERKVRVSVFQINY